MSRPRTSLLFMRSMMIVICICGALILCPPAIASSGAPDSAFGSGGVVTVASGGGPVGVGAFEADGSIVVAAENGRPFTLLHYSSTGTLDASFTTSGASSVPNCTSMEPARITLDPSGKILVAGPMFSSDVYEGTAIIRFLASGAVDTSFGSNGCTNFVIGGTVSNQDSGQAFFVVSLLVMPNGRILLGAPDGLHAYTAAGQADTSFGTNGYVALPSGLLPRAMAMQADGKVVVGGTFVFFPYYPDDASSTFMLARLNSDGSLDTSFGGTGAISASPVTGRASALLDLIVQPDGKIVAIGASADFPTGGTTENGVILRLTSSGSLDGSFGSSGVVLVNNGNTGTGSLTGVVLQPDGKILLTGISGIGSNLAIITRLDGNGSVDSTFGAGGLATISEPAAVASDVSDGTEYPILTSPDGSVLTMGQYYDQNDLFHFYLERLIANDPGNTGAPVAWGLQPESLSFASITDAPLASTQKSALAPISGLGSGVLVPALSGNGQSALDGSQTYDTSIKWVSNGSEIGLSQQASSAPDKTVTTTLEVGGILPTESPGYPLGAVKNASFSSTTTSTVTVPSVVGEAQNSAEAALSAAYLAYSATSQPSTTAAIGTVLLQSPSAGSQVTAGAAVALTVSSGISVPNVVGETQQQATGALSSAGLAAGTVTEQTSTTVTSGLVLTESPSASSSASPGTQVNLVVSSGTSVPNVVGATQADATSTITAAGLVLGTVTQDSSSSVPSGEVIQETPAAGTSENPGVAVNLDVSSGPAASASSSQSHGGGGAFDGMTLLALLIAAACRSSGARPGFRRLTSRLLGKFNSLRIA